MQYNWGAHLCSTAWTTNGAAQRPQGNWPPGPFLTSPLFTSFQRPQREGTGWIQLQNAKSQHNLGPLCIPLKHKKKDLGWYSHPLLKTSHSLLTLQSSEQEKEENGITILLPCPFLPLQSLEKSRQLFPDLPSGSATGWKQEAEADLSGPQGDKVKALTLRPNSQPYKHSQEGCPTNLRTAGTEQEVAQTHCEPLTWERQKREGAGSRDTPETPTADRENDLPRTGQ